MKPYCFSFNKLIIFRSLDLLLRNDSERIEAMKLMRKALVIAPSKFDISMARCLVSLAYEGSEAKDRMLRVCLATLSELGKAVDLDVIIGDSQERSLQSLPHCCL